MKCMFKIKQAFKLSQNILKKNKLSQNMIKILIIH